MQPQTSKSSSPTITSTFLSAGLLFLAGGLFFCTPLPAHALTVSPARIEITGNPGETVTSRFDVINEQGDAGTFYSSAENFEAQGETGTPSFVPATDGLATWINVQPTVSLSASQEEEIPFTITIPKDTAPGGYFAAIFLSTTPPQNAGGQVSVGARIGVLIFLDVAGDVKEAGGLLGFSAVNSERVFSSLPVTFEYRFNNAGGDRVEPSGTLTVLDSIGLTATSVPANPSLGNVLPNSIRRFPVTWGTDAAPPSDFFGAAGYEWSHFAFGWYGAHLNLTYGTHNEVAQASYTFFVIPWQLLTLIILALVVLYFLLKRYNRYVIESAARRSK